MGTHKGGGKWRTTTENGVRNNRGEENVHSGGFVQTSDLVKLYIVTQPSCCLVRVVKSLVKVVSHFLTTSTTSSAQNTVSSDTCNVMRAIRHVLEKR